MMNGYDEKHSYNDEPEPGSFVRAFDAFRKTLASFHTAVWSS
jgi:hypothetical protein